MEPFYRATGNNNLWFYSERGLLAFLFHNVLTSGDKVKNLLAAAKNAAGSNLLEAVGQFNKYRLIGEFSLGPRGFGSPDGVIFTGVDEGKTSCIFVEGKNFQVDKERRKGRNRPAVISPKPVSNSKLQRQLELKWRFKNALSGLQSGRKIIEQDLKSVCDELFDSDSYYRKNPTGRRSVELRQELLDCFRAAQDNFFLLAMTREPKFPEVRMNKVRLFNSKGVGQPASERVYWVSLNYLIDKKLVEEVRHAENATEAASN